MILPTVFGGVTDYLQTGGWLLRFHPSVEPVFVQDHDGHQLTRVEQGVEPVGRESIASKR